MWPVLAVVSATCVAATNHGTIEEVGRASSRTALCRMVDRNAGATADAAAAGTSDTAPTAYSALTDRVTREKPPLPQLGAAGFTFRDPSFGSRLMRVTDARTRPGVVNRSFRVPSNAHLAAWSADSRKFYVLSDDGASIPYTFDPSTMTASRLQPVSMYHGGMRMQFYGEPQFSVGNPSVMYGVLSGGNKHTIGKYDFITNTYATVVDLETFVGGLAGTYIGGLLTGGPTAEKLVTFFGGPQQ